MAPFLVCAYVIICACAAACTPLAFHLSDGRASVVAVPACNKAIVSAKCQQNNVIMAIASSGVQPTAAPAQLEQKHPQDEGFLGGETAYLSEKKQRTDSTESLSAADIEIGRRYVEQHKRSEEQRVRFANGAMESVNAFSRLMAARGPTPHPLARQRAASLSKKVGLKSCLKRKNETRLSAAARLEKIKKYEGKFQEFQGESFEGILTERNKEVHCISCGVSLANKGSTIYNHLKSNVHKHNVSRMQCTKGETQTRLTWIQDNMKILKEAGCATERVTHTVTDQRLEVHVLLSPHHFFLGPMHSV